MREYKLKTWGENMEFHQCKQLARTSQKALCIDTYLKRVEPGFSCSQGTHRAHSVCDLSVQLPYTFHCPSYLTYSSNFSTASWNWPLRRAKKKHGKFVSWQLPFKIYRNNLEWNTYKCTKHTFPLHKTWFTKPNSAGWINYTQECLMRLTLRWTVFNSRWFYMEWNVG